MYSLLKLKNITGRDIDVLLNTVIPLVIKLKARAEQEANKKEEENSDEEEEEKEDGNEEKKEHINPYKIKIPQSDDDSNDNNNNNNSDSLVKQEDLPPNWFKAVAPAGNYIYMNSETWMAQLDPPEKAMSDIPFVSIYKSPSFDSFRHFGTEFYEPLDEAYKSAGFKNIKKIKEEASEKITELKKIGALDEFGITDEEAEVLFSYTYSPTGKANKKELPYYIMNKVLAERNTNGIIKCRGYILHLLKALRNFKPV